MNNKYKLQEKASIDWNNYLTPEEVTKIQNSPNKSQMFKNIIYSNKFKDRYSEFKQSDWTKQELVKDLNNFYNHNHLITEGIHLVAYVRNPYTNEVQTMEDTDYNTKKQFSEDLKANEFTVLSVKDNKDLYVLDNSNYPSLSALQKDLRLYKKWYEEAKKDNPNTTLYKDDIEKLQSIYNEAIKQPLN